MDAPAPLILDLLASLKAGPRPYHEVMDAWRTNCPRLTVWEDAVELGLVRRDHGLVALTAAGAERLEQRR